MRRALLKRAKNFLTNAAPAATNAAGAAAPQVGDRRRRQVPGRSRRASGVTRVLSGSAVHETRRIFPSPFISKASRRVSSFFLRVQLSQPYVATGHTSAFVSRIFVEIGMLSLFHTFCSDAPIALHLFNLVRNSIFCNQGPKVRERIHLLQLFILNEYAARYAVARHNLGLVDVDE